MFKVGDEVRVRDNSEDLWYFTKRCWPVTGLVITRVANGEHDTVQFRSAEHNPLGSCYGRRLEVAGGPW